MLLTALNGKKTYIAAALAILAAVNPILVQYGIPHIPVEALNNVLIFAGGLGLIGIGHKADKLTNVVAAAALAAAGSPTVIAESDQ